MEEFEIYFSDVWKQYRASGTSSSDEWFAIQYRKADDIFGKKVQVRRVAGKAPSKKKEERTDLRQISYVEKQTGKMHLETPDGHRFDIWACLLTHFNGKLIDHRF